MDSVDSKADSKAAMKDTGPRKALGRGLAALMPPDLESDSRFESGSEKAVASKNQGLRYLPIESIHPNRHQPRKQFDTESLDDLARSIQVQGILQPVVVRRRKDGDRSYEIVAGERRWRAAGLAGLHEIPALVKDFTDPVALQVALIENIQRQDLDPLEEAEAYSRLIREYGLTHEQVAASVGKSRSAITNSLRLLKVPEEVLKLLAEGRLTAGHVRALMMIPDKAQALQLAQDLAQRHREGHPASVREVERQARQLLKQASAAAVAQPRNPSEIDIEEQLQRVLGTKVRLYQDQGCGRIEIYFYSLEGLDGLLEKLTGV